MRDLTRKNAWNTTNEYAICINWSRVDIFSKEYEM